MAEKPPINFLERARAIKEAREGESKNSVQQVSQNETASETETTEEPRNLVTPIFGAKPLAFPTPRPPHESPQEHPPQESFAEPLPITPGKYSMRTFSRVGDRLGHDMIRLAHLVGNTEAAQTKYSHLVKMDAALYRLRTQMSKEKEMANVAMRRGLIRGSGTEDLVDQFWSSNEHDWSARPSTYLALLDELDERGFFTIPTDTPEPKPLTPKVWDEPDMNPDDDNPRSPGRPHRDRPKR